MKERPILFSGPMVRALLAGHKTMTRRIVKPQPEYADPIRKRIVPLAEFDGQTLEAAKALLLRKCPYGQPGDRLWVRETWAWRPDPDEGLAASGARELIYRADGHAAPLYNGTEKWRSGWSPSIHMPRWASRITLEVAGVRVERLQEIATTRETQGDIIAEGVWPREWSRIDGNDQREFARVWDSINAKRGYSWASNPWVWVVEFKRVTP